MSDLEAIYRDALTTRLLRRMSHALEHDLKSPVQGIYWSLELALKDIPGRENVRYVILDLCDPFKNFAKDFFPQAQLVADKFHVLRLLSPAINRRRKAITGDRRSLEVRRWLLRNGKSLHPTQRFLLNQWLQGFPELLEVYHFKEALHGFYRIRGRDRAELKPRRRT